MPFLTQGKTNWKYILVVLILAVIVGGGILGWIKKEEISPPELLKIEEPEEKTEKFTLDKLKNAEYYTITYEETVQLKDGFYRKEYLGMASGLEVGIYKDKIAFGDLNNDEKEDAAVVLYSTGGGSGTFRELAIMINEDGDPSYLTSEHLGDRVVINSIDIQSGIITLDMIVHGPEDAMCCPSLKKTFKYRLSENQLVEVIDDQTVNWKTYQGSEMKFSIKYPPEFKISPASPGTHEWARSDVYKTTISSRDSFFMVTEGMWMEIVSWTKWEPEYGFNSLSGWINYIKRDYWKIPDWIKRDLSEEQIEEFEKIKEEDFILDNIPAEKLSGKDIYRYVSETKTLYFHTTIFIFAQNKERMYQIKTGIYPERENVYLSIFNQMLSTFRFIEEDKTQVIRYTPTEAPEEVYEGSCWTNSLSAPRKDAWRCRVNNTIYDPCFVFKENESLVCNPNPITGDKGILLKLTEPLPEPNITEDKFGEGWGWLIELKDGTVCRFITGATGIIDRKRMNYGCDKEDTWVLGELQTGTIWKAETAVVESVEGKFIAKSVESMPIRTVWQ